MTREERKERYKLLQEYEKRDYQDEVNIDEFQDFIKLYIDKVDISSQFIKKFIKVLKDNINNGGTFALKFLLGDNEEYIEECRIYYNAWFDFLDNKDKYKSYEEYLEKNNIEY